VTGLNTLGKLEKLLLDGEITEEEYRNRKADYIDTILEMYAMGIITKEQLQDRLND
jgi:hypothetical protein